jgi:hypothetical protein
MLEPLRDETYFGRVFLEFGAPTWPNGCDIAPEWLRREMAAAGELTRVAATGASATPSARASRNTRAPASPSAFRGSCNC